MSCRKILLNTHNIFMRKNVPFKKGTGEMITRGSAVCTPPRVKISFAEKAFFSTALSVSILAYPAWVLYKIPQYGSEKTD